MLNSYNSNGFVVVAMFKAAIFVYINGLERGYNEILS